MQKRNRDKYTTSYTKSPFVIPLRGLIERIMFANPKTHTQNKRMQHLTTQKRNHVIPEIVWSILMCRKIRHKFIFSEKTYHEPPAYSPRQTDSHRLIWYIKFNTSNQLIPIARETIPTFPACWEYRGDLSSSHHAQARPGAHRTRPHPDNDTIRNSPPRKQSRHNRQKCQTIYTLMIDYKPHQNCLTVSLRQ